MEDMTCSRCGFFLEGEVALVEIEGWPVGVAHPPLPVEAHPHPAGVCCSPFKIGDMLWWDLDLLEQDLPPLRVFFKTLTSIESPEFKLESGEWVQRGVRRAEKALVQVVKSSVYPCHEDLLGIASTEAIEVYVSGLTPLDRWPVLEVA